MKNFKEKRNIFLIITLLSILFIQYFLKNQNLEIKSKYFNDMLKASKKMKILSEEIKKEKLARGIKIDQNIDRNMTGLIGVEWSEISTTLGNEVSKRTTTNTDFAALIVKKFKELNLKSGDKVAVNMSGSFPALNIALISALDTLNLEGIIVNSVGSSNYGANIKNFTYLDMENFLYNRGLIKNRTRAYSFGGIDDIGKEFSEETKNLIRNKNKNYNLKFFYNPNLEENINQRYKFYTQNNKIKAFVNIGGNILSFGKSYDEVENSDVILGKNLKIKDGLVGKFYNSQIPVLHFLNIKGIAFKNNIKIDSSQKEIIGKTDIYYNKVSNLYYNILIVIIFLLFILYNIYGIKKFKR